MSTDWQAWHAAYDDPGSSLSRRLAVVRGQVVRVLSEQPDGPVQIVGICSGDGRDTLPDVARLRPDSQVVLIELDDELAAAARRTAGRLGLAHVEVRTADAGDLASYDGVPPADLVLATGVFGNVADSDVGRTVTTLPRLLRPGARVIWTRGHRTGPHDPTSQEGDASTWVRAAFDRAGYVEEAFMRPEDATYRVGVHRWPGRRMFTFVR